MQIANIAGRKLKEERPNKRVQSDTALRPGIGAKYVVNRKRGQAAFF
jgi:hypothetical protein